MSSFAELAYDAPNAGGFRAAAKDLMRGLGLWRLWINLAWHGLHQRYRRTWLGMGWISVSFALFVLVKIVIFGPLSSAPPWFYAVNMTAGFLVFRFIANSVTGGGSAFLAAQNWIKSEPLPLAIHIYKLIVNNFIIFGFAAIPTALICAWYRVFHIEFLYLLPLALIVYALNGVWVSIVMGIICARYRDIMHFSGTVMQVLYFATPILWVPPETGFRANVAIYNPLTHYIAIFREPLLSGNVPWASWAVVIVGTVLGLILAFILFSRSRLRLIFWL